MFRKTTVLAAALATTAMLALAAGPASAARVIDYPGGDATSIPVFVPEPTGPGVLEAEPGKNYESDDEYEGCKAKAESANKWLDTARHWHEKNLPNLQALAEENADKIAGEANKNGCNLIQPE